MKAQFGEFRLSIPIDHAQLRNRPISLKIKAMTEDHISFLFEVASEIRAVVDLEVKMEKRDIANPSEEEDNRSFSKATPKARSIQAAQKLERPQDQFEFKMPWSDLLPKIKQYTGKADILRYHAYKPRGIPVWQDPVSLESDINIDSELSPVNFDKSLFMVTYGQPSKAKSDMIISNYYRIENFFQSCGHLLVDRSLVCRDIWSKLLVGLDPYIVSVARKVSIQRAIDKGRRYRRQRDAFKIGIQGDIHKVSAQTMEHVMLDDLNYTNIIVNEVVNYAPNDELDQSEGYIDDAILMKDLKMAARSPIYVPFIKLMVIQTPCKINRDFGVILFRIKEAKFAVCYKVLGSRNRFDPSSIVDLIEFVLYVPKRQTFVSINESQSIELFNQLGAEFCQTEIFSAFYRRLKASEIGIDHLARVFATLATHIGHNTLKMSIDVDTQNHEKSIFQLGIEDKLIEDHPITLHTMTDKMIADFHSKVTRFEIDLRQNTKAVFLKHYNSVKRIHTKSRLYLNLMYGGMPT